MLAGTYELLAFCNLSGQLSRRTLHIHFARYFAESREDVQIFKNVVHTFQKAFPTRADSNLVTEWEFLYEGSVGCVGILKDWLMRASIAARRGAHHVLTRKILEETALSASQCEKILVEAREGETRLTEGPESRSRLRNLLGLTAGSVETFPACKAQPNKQLRRQRRPGERLPKRDPVGQAATTSVPRDDLRAMGA